MFLELKNQPILASLPVENRPNCRWLVLWEEGVDCQYQGQDRTFLYVRKLQDAKTIYLRFPDSSQYYNHCLLEFYNIVVVVVDDDYDDDDFDVVVDVDVVVVVAVAVAFAVAAAAVAILLPLICGYHCYHCHVVIIAVL
eukprot:2020277-Ditylum_brightwellii.AAC.1